MNMKRIICALLSLMMVFGGILPYTVEPVFAAWEDKVDKDGNPIIDYFGDEYDSPKEKLADMILVKEQSGHQLWFEEFTGEIAYVDLASGQILFSNPWDVAQPYNNASKNTKPELLSQLLISYVDNGQTKTMNSYTDAAMRGQIQMKNIKNGIRVEYTIGEEQTIRLVPRMIERSRFETLIRDCFTDEWMRNKVTSYYSAKFSSTENISKRALLEMQAKYPITKELDIYVCKQDISPRELKQLEGYIKTWCTSYTYEDLEADHAQCGYVGSDAAPPLFKMAIEYTITPEGDLKASLPANGIRFDESVYKLGDISLLPYMGAGANEYNGYTFVPDGSGALVRYEDVKGLTYNIYGQLYGVDYAYHTISNQHTEVMRWPVFGNVTNMEFPYTEKVTVVVTPEYIDEDGNVVPAVTREISQRKVRIEDMGVFGVITEGESLATLVSAHGGSYHAFNTVYAKFTPRPSDKYNLSSAMTAAGTSATWTVESDRKYTGRITVLYKMLTDDQIAAEKQLTNYYTADYMGMVEAYRDHLYGNGTLTTLADTTEDIPLYIEAFGSLETTERRFSFPVTVDTPLTTFEDIKTMHKELTEAGVGKLNFRLVGFANGGMSSTVPYKLKWMDVLGGSDGFTDIVKYASENNIGIYPDFDFAYVTRTELGDGMSLRKYAVKTIDDRYTSRRTYDAATQTFTSDFSLCISPSAYSRFYSKFTQNYAKYNPTGISVSTLGTELNSDFDEDDPYNREDSKGFTVELLQRIDSEYASVMVDGGNAYALPYVDHIMNMSTDSSNYMKASQSIPFMGMVLHGAKYFAGTPLNMEGDVDSAILKAIENGAGLYFTLSYQNTNKLKESAQLSKYYSVSYEIWKEELIEHYTTLNDAIGDLQTSLIVGHEFIYGERIPDADEAEADAEAARLEAEAKAEAEAIAKEKAERAEKYEEMHKALEENGEDVADEPDTAEDTATDDEADAVEEDDVEDETDAEQEEEEDTLLGDYVATKYTTTLGSIVCVTYDAGVTFILNYNSFDVTVQYNGQNYTIDALGFVRIN